MAALARFRDRSGLCCTVLPLQLISVRPDVDTGDERVFSWSVLRGRGNAGYHVVQLNRWCAVSALGCQQSSAHCFAPTAFTFSHGQPLPMRFRVWSGLFILRPTHYTSYKAGREATAHRKLSSPRQCGRQGTIVSAIHPLPPSANKCMISIFKFFF
jgi:hypothetical protein